MPKIDHPASLPLTAPAPLLPDILALHGRWRAASPALVFEGETVLWSALIQAVNRVANGLIALGLGRGDVVVVAMENERETVEVLLGIACSGCISAPLNLTISDDAMAAMIQDAGARAVIATPAQAERIDRMDLPAGLHCVRVGDEGEIDGWLDYGNWLAIQAALTPAVAIAPDDGFNIIYSSGTTGRPKGILHTHATRLAWARDLALALRYHSGARTLCTLGLYSNIACVMLLCTFLVGGTLHLTRRFDTGPALALIARQGITHTAMVPVQYQRLLDHPAIARTDTGSMQAMMSCGSSLPERLKAGLFEQFACGVIELYGLTEGVITTLDPEDAPGRLASVGKPLPGTDLKIIDEDGVECPAGTAGEIVSRGAIVMPGYWRNPDATGEASWTDPSGRTWLRTGDIGKLDAERFLYIVDRKKDMIVSGGQNIFPADIEQVLIAHEGVSAAAVIGLPDAVWGETPVGVVEARPGGALVTDELLDWVNQRVGKRQRLSALHIVAELPRNPNGKVLKRELRAKFGPPG
ncbi:class I adenylate-forming enzyme family protein [Maricaulis sp.]|uniref:class I adenylate-forming enzyme family protein n=1 Tax=Maricaulis sp. TaxID=1486257 RepID=UPI003A946757